LLFRWCRQARLQEADAADVIQEVYSAVASGIEDYHHHQEGDTFRGWLRRITQHKICDWARTGRREARGAGGSAAQEILLEVADHHLPDPDEVSERQDQLLVWRRAVDCILADYQEATRIAFLRVVVEGDHPADVAEDLGMTRNAVYLLKGRILKRIRQEFAGLVDL